MLKKLPIWLTAPVLFLIVTLIVSAGGWLFWFNTRPVYDKEKWDKMTSSPPEFILYLFDPTPSNAVRTLRDGLMNELARSGQLPPGYPKLRSVPWANNAPSCQYKDFVFDKRYFIQLTETYDNYIELPLCPRTVMDYHLAIHILPPWPWAQLNYDTPEIFIGLVRSGVFGEEHLLRTGQKELILKSLENLGAKLYLNEYLQYDLKYGK